MKIRYKNVSQLKNLYVIEWTNFNLFKTYRNPSK